MLAPNAGLIKVVCRLCIKMHILLRCLRGGDKESEKGRRGPGDGYTRNPQSTHQNGIENVTAHASTQCAGGKFRVVA
jgi:hypothetical protein